MSMAFDSSMEALAINYLNHGVLTAINNVWAWIAFLTAAISFWKIKSSIHLSPHHHHRSLLLSSKSPPPQPQIPAEPDHQQELPSTTATTPSFTSSKRYTTFCTLENRKSGKFSVYYAQDDNIGSIRRNCEQEKRMIGSIRLNHEEEERKIGSIRRNVGWEAVLKMKAAEMEWYRCQDLTVLHGNVVQLWN